MKILILLIKWPGGVGGGVKNITNELRSLGHEVDVLSRNEYFNTNSLVKSFFKVRGEVKKLIKEKNYDIVYTQDWSMALPLLVPFPIFKEKHFCMFHGNPTSFSSLVMQEFVALFLRKHLCCMAPSIKKRFPLANINYCGVNLNQFYDIKKKRIFLGWIQKGTEQITPEEVEKLAKKVKLPLLIAKGFTHEEMNEKFYNRLKVFLSFPPNVAGFQASWLEAMAAGVPIVFGNNHGAGDVQPFYKIENPHDINNLAEKIKKAKKHNYRKWIKEKDFTWNRHTKRLIEIFDKV